MLDIYKICVCVILFLLALGCGILPILWRRNTNALGFLPYGEALARGVFLGAGFIHLLPDAVEHFQVLYPQYPWPFAICVTTILLLYCLEQCLAEYGSKLKTINWQPYILLTVLAIHSWIEGMAMGISSTTVAFLIIFIAIIAHKGAVAFALGINLRRYHLSNNACWRSLILFAGMTPLGLLMGTGLLHFFQERSGLLAESIFNAIAAGTFIYLATIAHAHAAPETTQKYSLKLEISLIALGFMLMAVIAIWV